MKIVNIDTENHHISWANWGIKMKFSGKMWLMIIWKATKNKRVHPLFRRYNFGKTRGVVKFKIFTNIKFFHCRRVFKGKFFKSQPWQCCICSSTFWLSAKFKQNVIHESCSPTCIIFIFSYFMVYWIFFFPVKRNNCPCTKHCHFTKILKVSNL